MTHRRPLEPARPDPAMLEAFLQAETSDDPPSSQELLISPGAGVYLPVPSRWLAVPVVKDRMEAWSLRRKDWISDPQRATWEPKGSAHADLAILLRMEQSWESDITSYQGPDGKPITRKEVQAEIARMLEKREKAFRLPTQPTGPCWAALTPQGPVLLQTTEAWVKAWDGSLILAYQAGSGSHCLLPSVLQVIQMEPMEEDQAQHWAHWAYRNGDFYLIP